MKMKKKKSNETPKDELFPNTAADSSDAHLLRPLFVIVEELRKSYVGG